MHMDLISALSHIIEFFIVFSFANGLFPIKIKKQFAVIIGFLFYSAAFLVFLLFDSTIVNIIFCFAIDVLFAKLCYECSFKGAILSALFLSVANTATEFIVMNVLAIVSGGDIKTYISNVYTYLLTVIISKTVFLIITKSAIFAGLYLQGQKIIRFPAFLLIYPITSIVVLYTFWIISVRYELSQNISIVISAAGIAIILSTFLTFVFYGKTSQKMDELFKAQSEAERIQADKAYYAILDQQNEMLKTITHDEKNHLIAIKALADDPDVSAYIDKIYGEIKYHSMFGNTQNRFLDLLLNKYKSICYSNGITFDFSIKTANLSFMEAPDMITLVSNILDNSVEAAMQSSEKRIELSINKVNKFDIFTCTNSCDSRPHAIGKMLQTTKKAKGFHGFGMRSVKAIVSKYNGEFDWSYDEGKKEFAVNIAFFT